MIVIGITGGIGSGKSTVCKIFASMGIPVNDADALAKNIITTDAELKQNIIKHFGADSYLADGSYNRAHISSIVFNDATKLALLNSLVHPKVIEYGNNWVKQYQHLPYVIKEAALMFESGSYKHNDYTIVVESPMDTRVERICKRDKVTKEIAQKRIDAQLSDEQRREMADLIISNEEEQSLIHQVYKIHQHILKNNDPR
jgi:dephospho-CoA kinase